MTTYFIWTTRRHVSRRHAAEIDAAVKAIDPAMDFVRHYSAGNEIHGWLERPNDGTNDHNYRRARNAECVAIADRILPS